MKSLRQRAVTASLYTSGAEGPLRTALDRLRDAGFGERMLKSALAAGIAWQVGRAIHTDPAPVLAPITAVFTIQLTVAKSIGGTIQRLLGVIIGILVALLIHATAGVNAFTIAALVLVTIAGGLRLGLEQSGVEQMTVSALLVLIAGATTRSDLYAGYHLLDTAVGAAIGLTLNWLVAPPSYVASARASVQSFGERLVELLDSLAEGFAVGMDQPTAKVNLLHARVVAADIAKTQSALVRAEESLRFNLPGLAQRAALTRYIRANRALEHCAVQTRVISRTVLDAVQADSAEPWLSSNELGAGLAELFSAIARYLESYLLALDLVDAKQDDALLADIGDRREKAESMALADPRTLRPGRWVLLGELLSISDQLVTDLSSLGPAALESVENTEQRELSERYIQGAANHAHH